MERSEWLKGLKEGDTVIVNGRFNEKNVGKVKRFTNTLIIVCYSKNLKCEDIEYRFRRIDGVQPASCVWDHCIISEATKQELDLIEYRKLAQKARNMAQSISVPKTIEGVKQLIDDLMKYQLQKGGE